MGNETAERLSAARLAEALSVDDSSARLQAALTAGTYADSAYLEPLLARCAVEIDFYVRDMLTWALTRLPREVVLPAVIAETQSDTPQAVSQALHTLSKLGDADSYSAITAEHLHSEDDEIARTAWRAAAGLAPFDERGALAAKLVSELGRGGLEVKRSLSRALVELGEAPILAVKAAALEDDDERAQHAHATLRLIEDPEASFTLD